MKKEQRQIIKANGSAESDEYKKLIILIVIIAAVFILFYVLTTMFTKKNSDNIFKNDLNATEIKYDEILAGDMFTKNGSYYVLLIEEDDQYKDLFDSYISDLDTKIYKVDLSSAFNKKYLSDEYSYKEDNFKTKGTVLIKVEDHKIVGHYETKEGIIEKLKDLKK